MLFFRTLTQKFAYLVIHMLQRNTSNLKRFQSSKFSRALRHGQKCLIISTLVTFVRELYFRTKVKWTWNDLLMIKVENIFKKDVFCVRDHLWVMLEIITVKECVR